MFESSFPKKQKIDQPNEIDADDSEDFKTPSAERLKPVIQKSILKQPKVIIPIKELRSNTDPNDFKFKDKSNPMTGNGNARSWITKQFF